MVTLNNAIGTILSFALCAQGSNGMGFAEQQWSSSVGFEIGEGNVVEWVNEGENILVTGKCCEISILDKYGDVMVMDSGSDEYSCSSSVVHTKNHDFIYQAVNFKNETYSSFLQCLDKDTLVQKWNISIPGKIEGTPVMGDYVYLVHNTFFNGTASGHISIVSFDGELKYNETRENVLFAPLAIQVNPIQGPYSTGSANKNDLLAWGKKYDPIYNKDQDKTSANYFFQLPKGNIDFTNLSNQIRTGGITGFTLSAPTLTGHFTNKYLALEFFKIRGFVTSTASTELKRWGGAANLLFDPPQGETSKRVPPPNGPLVLDAYNNNNNNGYIIVTGSRFSKGVFAYKLNDDQSLVSNFTDVGFVAAKMQMAMDNSCLFFIQETDNGSNITGVDFVAGSKHFELMINATHSEFSIFNDTYLVYGTNTGQINTIKLKDTDDSLIASTAPSNIPSATPSQINTKPPSVHSYPDTPAPTPTNQEPTSLPPAPTNLESTSAPTPAAQSPSPTATSSAMSSTTMSVFGFLYLVFCSLAFW